jgi:hypothetical protein
MKLRLAPVTRPRQADEWQHLRGRRRGLEAPLRICQLILFLCLAVFGASYLAKGIVQAGKMLAGLLA